MILVLEKIRELKNYNYLLESKINRKILDSPKVEGIILDTRKINLDDYPHLKVVSRVGVGLDNIDLKECKKRNIKVSTTPCHELTDSVAEFTVMQILNFLRNKRETLYDKTIGIIGYGRIGQTVENILNFGFEADIYWCDTFQKIKNHNITYNCMTLNEILNCDIICVHISGNKEVIGEKEIKQMKETTIIVNMARADCVNINAVISAVNDKRLGGYISDVDDLSELENLNMLPKNILITPHIASDTIQARKKIEELAIENLIEGLKNEEEIALNYRKL